jgi:hypothetical protein
MTIFNSVFESKLFRLYLCSDVEIYSDWAVETFKNSGEDMTGRSVSGPRCGKRILEMIVDLKILVQVNFKDSSRGRSVIGDFDIILLGSYWEYRAES